MGRYFPDWIAAYIQHTQHLEAPDVFHFWTAVSVIAGALRRRVWILQGYFEWVPNFYIIFVAPPGIVNKSTTINVGMQLLKRIDGVHFGPNAVTMPALIQALSQCTEAVLMDDTIGEYHPMSCLTIAASELGTLFNPNDREMVDVLVDLWDGRRDVWKKVTKMSGSDSVENPWLNIIACTTPGWISEHMPEAMIGGGFTSRCIFVYGHKKRYLVAYPGDHIPKNFEDEASRLVHDLEIIANLKGAFSLSDDARAFGKTWYEAIHTNPPAHLSGERFGGYLARKQVHVHKLAMVLSAAKRNTLVIEKSDLEQAIAITDATEQDMTHTFDRVGQSNTGRRLAELLDIIRSAGSIDRTALFRRMMRTVEWKEFEGLLQSAIIAGYVEQTVSGQKVMVRVKT